MDIVTGHVGSAHVTSWQDRDLNQGIFGPDTYILNVGSKLAATIISNNEIRIADGTLVMQGCQGVIQKGTYDTISIDNGTQGLKRNDLICAQYTKSAGVESMSLVVIKGTAASTPVDPSYTSGDIQNGDTPVQVPIYRVSLNGLTLESVEALVNTTQPITGIGTLYNNSETVTASNNTMAYGASITIPAGLYLVFGSIYFAGVNSGKITMQLNPSDLSEITYYTNYHFGETTDPSVSQKIVKVTCLVEARDEIGLEIAGVQTSGSSSSATMQLTALRLR